MSKKEFEGKKARLQRIERSRKRKDAARRAAIKQQQLQKDEAMLKDTADVAGLEG